METAEAPSRSGSRWLGSALLRTALCALLFSSINAHAKGAKKDEAASVDVRRCRGVKSAAELLRAGIAALSAADLPSARQALTEAYLCELAPEPLYHLARMAEREGLEMEAHNLIRRFIDDPGSNPDDAMRAVSTQLLNKPLPVHGKVKVHGDSGAMLWIDERLAGSLPLPRPLALKTGKHQVQLDYRRKRRQGTIEVLAGRVIEIQFEANTDAVVMNIVPAALIVDRMSGLNTTTQRTMLGALLQVVESHGLSPLLAQEAVGRSPQLASCLHTIPCQSKLAEENFADYVVIAELSQQLLAQHASLQGALSIIDPAVASVAGSTRFSCEGCNDVKASTRLKQTLETLWNDSQSKARGTLDVRSDPNGAELTLDGHVIGTTPYQHAAFVGKHEIVITRPNFQAERRTIQIEKDDKVELSVALQPSVSDPVRSDDKTRHQRPIWRLALGATVMTLGVLMTGFGAAALSEDAQCVHAPDPMALVCRKLYDTHGLGAGLVGAGIPILAGGVLLIAWPAR